MNFALNEIKKWYRDPLMQFMVVYPLFFAALGRFALPWIADASGFSLDPYADFIVVVLGLFTPHIFGAVAGFSILDDRDDNILTAVKVTPLSIHQFMSFKLALVFVLSLISTVFVIWFSDIGDIPFDNILAISLLASMAAPMTGLLINSLAGNKIEGFAIMKGTGVIVLFPLASLIFTDAKEFIFSFAPGFWSAKCISSIVRGPGILQLSYGQYYFIGLVYIILLNFVSYMLFIRKTRA